MADYQYDGQARKAAVARAKAWTQAARLNTTPDAITASIILGNLPSDIETMTSRHELELSPAEAVARKIAAAEVRPIRLSAYEVRLHESIVSRPRKAA